MFKVVALLSIVGYVPATTLQDFINQQSQIATQNAISYNLQYQSSHTCTETRNKRLVLRFLDRVFAQKDFDAIDEYLSENFIQHSHDVADGKEGLKAAVKEWLKDYPKREKEDVKRVAADGDLVWVHVRANYEQWGGPDEAIMEIYRVEHGKIAEHWDVLQNVPKTPSKNNNTIF